MKHKKKNTHPLKYLSFLEKELNESREKIFELKLSDEEGIREQLHRIESLTQEIKNHKHSMTEEELDIYYSIKELNIKKIKN
jgi:hypothetical protein